MASLFFRDRVRMSGISGRKPMGGWIDVFSLGGGKYCKQVCSSFSINGPFTDVTVPWSPFHVLKAKSSAGPVTNFSISVTNV